MEKPADQGEERDADGYQTCCAGSGYALTYGRRNAVLAVKAGDRPMVRVVNDRGRRNWA